MTTDTTITTNDHAWELTALSPVLGDLSIPLTTSPNASLSIGRHTDNDVVLAVPQVSRRHAKFNQVGQHLYLQDLNSANGTFVNGQRIGNDAIEVTANTEIGFADLLFVLSLNNASSVADITENPITETIAEAPAFAEKTVFIPSQTTENLETIAEKVAPKNLTTEKQPHGTVATETVTLPPQVVETVAVLPTATSVIDETMDAPTITAPISPQIISPITTTASPVVENKNPASKNMWLIAIVIILFIAGLVIAKMVL